MLKLRLYTVALALPLLLAAIFFLPTLGFEILIGIIVGWVAWEWSQFATTKRVWRQTYTLVLMMILAVLGYILSPLSAIGLSKLFFFYACCGVVLFWLWPIASVMGYAKYDAPLGFQYPSIIMLFGGIALPMCWISIILLRAYSGPSGLLFCLILIWSVDIGAYSLGRMMGKTALLPRVSPKKTWEGCWGGFGLCLFILVIAVLISHHYILLWLGPTLVLLAVFGDLFESMLKRQCHIKDSGKVLPGHGGMLDRFDSMMPAMPLCLCFVLGLKNGLF